MGSRQLRSDIPINLPETFKEEARELRNKLLLYRFHRRLEVKLDPGLADPKLEPRLNQILLPLLSVVSDEGGVADVVGIRCGAISGKLRVSDQAARSMGLAASVCQPSTLRMLIGPDASRAQNSIAAVSAEGSTVWVLIVA